MKHLRGSGLAKLRAKGLFRTMGVAVGVVAVSAALAACGSDDSGSGSGGGGGDEEVSIGFFGLSARNVYTTTMYEAAEDEAKKLGAKMEFFDGEYDGGVQARQVQDATTSGRFDALILMPNDAVSIARPAEQAAEAGLTVTSVQYPIGTEPTEAKPTVEGVTAQVIEDVVTAAEGLAESTNEACVDRDPCQVMFLWGNRQSASEEAKRDPYLDALDEGIELVSEVDTQFLKDDARKMTADTLRANPDIDVIVSSGDQMTLGAQEAIESAGDSVGTDPDDIILVGYGATYEGVKAVKSGEWLSSFVLLPQTMGRKVVELTVDASRGEEIAEADTGIDQSDLSPVGVMATKKSLGEDPSFKGEYAAE